MNLYNSETYKKDIETAISSVVGIEKLDGASVLITGASGLIGSFLVDVLAFYNRKTTRA